MTVHFSVCEGDTEPIVIQLYEVNAAGVSVDLDATGFTLSDMVITANDGTLVVSTNKFDWSGDEALGRVAFEPAANDFNAAKSPYRFRTVLIDGEGDIRSYPDDAYGFVLGVNKR